MSEHPFHKFLDLINFDQNLHGLQLKLALLTRETKQINDQEHDLSELLQVAKNKVMAIRNAVNQLELEMKKIDQQQKNKKAQLDDTSKYKEYQSLQKEYERLQELQHSKESELLQQWKMLELAEQKVAAEQKDFESKTAQFHVAIEEKKESMVATQAHIAQQEVLRISKEKLVPAQWLEKYNIMRLRVADPVVAIQGAYCAICFQDITKQEMVRLKRGALLQCQGCYRLLYASDAIVDDSMATQEE